jgi:hypothetical protein
LRTIASLPRLDLALMESPIPPVQCELKISSANVENTIQTGVKLGDHNGDGVKFQNAGHTGIMPEPLLAKMAAESAVSSSADLIQHGKQERKPMVSQPIWKKLGYEIPREEREDWKEFLRNLPHDPARQDRDSHLDSRILFGRETDPIKLEKEKHSVRFLVSSTFTVRNPPK